MVKKKNEKKENGVRASVIVFLCTCLSFSVDVCCAGRRQLRVPSEGPPGVFAPVVEQRVGGGGGGAAVFCPFYLTETEHCAAPGLVFTQ